MNSKIILEQYLKKQLYQISVTNSTAVHVLDITHFFVRL